MFLLDLFIFQIHSLISLVYLCYFALFGIYKFDLFFGITTLLFIYCQHIVYFCFIIIYVAVIVIFILNIIVFVIIPFLLIFIHFLSFSSNLTRDSSKSGCTPHDTTHSIWNLIHSH